MLRRHVWKLALALTIAAFAIIAQGCGGSSSSSNNPSSASTSEPTGNYTLTVAYGSDYVFDTTALTSKWWNQVKAQFLATHPNATIKFEQIPGSYQDIVNKLSLLYRSPSTAPDVAEIPTGQIGLWSQTNYLLPLNNYLASTSWWSTFPKVIQSEGTFNGSVYAVDQGENDSALLYNETMFRKAGIALPWNPKSWQDIITAAQKIKATNPRVIPLWLNAGSGSGANGLLQGINNFIVGTATPTIEASNGKMVVDSPGIRQALTFYKEAYSAGLGASVSDLFSPNAVTAPLTLFQKGQLAIAVGSNYYGGNWTKFISAPYWPQAPKVMGEAVIPTYDGTGVASTLGGWDYAIAAKSKEPKAAFDFINTMENEQNSIDAANWAGWVPPNGSYWAAPSYTTFAPPYNAYFAKIASSATLTPSGANYSVWVQGMGQATGMLAQHPNTSVDAAVNALKTYVTNQLGPDQVETLP
jgi:multiple sugar transport system substrate-binding protein